MRSIAGQTNPPVHPQPPWLRWGIIGLLAAVALLLLSVVPALWRAYAGNRGSVALLAALSVVADTQYYHGPQATEIYLPGEREISLVQSDAAEAVAWLTTAGLWGSAESVHTQRLAQAHALAGQFTAAAQLLTSSREAGDVESGIGAALLYFGAGDMDIGYDLWQDLGLDRAAGLALADQYFSDRYYGNASALYAAFLPATEPDAQADVAQLFSATVAATAAGHPAAERWLAALKSQDAAYTPLDAADATIPGNRLHWLEAFPEFGIAPGSFLYEGDIDGEGVMLWAGSAIALLEAAQPGTYCLTAVLRNVSPGGVEVALGVDGQTLRTLQLAGAPDSLVRFVVPVNLAAGRHFAGVTFLNDALVDGVDRNAVIHQLSVAAPADGGVCE